MKISKIKCEENRCLWKTDDNLLCWKRGISDMWVWIIGKRGCYVAEGKINGNEGIFQMVMVRGVW